MRRRFATLILLVTFSLVSTTYSLLLILNLRNAGTMYAGPSTDVLIKYPYAIFPVVISSLGWLASGYELLAKPRDVIYAVIKKEMAEDMDMKTIDNLFKRRGAGRRFIIMASLDMPRFRNEIAEITGIDWKEVDRNIRILSSAKIVRVQSIHNSIHLYELTGDGRKIVQKVKSVIG